MKSTTYGRRFHLALNISQNLEYLQNIKSGISHKSLMESFNIRSGDQPKVKDNRQWNMTREHKHGISQQLLIGSNLTEC